MKKTAGLLAALALAVGAHGSGCGGDPCADAAQQYEDCDKGIPSNLNSSGECTEDEQCVAECVLDEFEDCDHIIGLSTDCYQQCN